jgi:hypothetical protein
MVDLASLKVQIASLDASLGSAFALALSTETVVLERDPIFGRTKRCSDATLDESRAHCAKWDKARQLLQTAKRRNALRSKMETIDAQLRTAPIRESVDPKVEAVARALAFAGIQVSLEDIRYYPASCDHCWANGSVRRCDLRRSLAIA